MSERSNVVNLAYVAGVEMIEVRGKINKTKKVAVLKRYDSFIFSFFFVFT